MATDTHARHAELGLGDDDVLAMYRAMLLARAVDERIWPCSEPERPPSSSAARVMKEPRPQLPGHCGADRTGWRRSSVHRQRHDVRDERRGHHHCPPREGR